MPFRDTVGSGRGWGPTLRALLFLLVVFVLVGAGIGFSIARRGLSVHGEPSRVEQLVAHTMRSWATPRTVRERLNPVPPSEAVFDQALEHFADHCATCHANDGSGDTTVGRGLYPRVPDMRTVRTQSLADGELFWIIEHGIRMTGMPGWGNGTPESERESWGLVHFIRRLPRLTPEDLERMDGLNPKTPAALRAEEEARRFLAGGPSPVESPSPGNSR
jgi:mono/diheme cytochrome c family protein